QPRDVGDDDRVARQRPPQRADQVNPRQPPRLPRRDRQGPRWAPLRGGGGEQGGERRAGGGAHAERYPGGPARFLGVEGDLGEGGRARPPVAACVKRQPTASRPSACANSGENCEPMSVRSEVARYHGRAALSGWSDDRAALPMNVWNTGAPSRSASRAS